VRRKKSSLRLVAGYPVYSLAALLGPVTAFVYDGNSLTDDNISFGCLILSIFLSAIAAGSVDQD